MRSGSYIREVRGKPGRIPGFIGLFCALALSFAMSLSGCKDRDESLLKAYLKRPLSGMVNGKEWRIRYAFIDPTVRTEKENDYVFVFLPFKPKDPCPGEGELPLRTPMAMVPAPDRESRRSLKLERGTPRALVFQFDRRGEQVALVGKTGRIRITRSTDDFIRGKVVARYDSETWLNGRFKAERCAYAEFR